MTLTILICVHSKDYLHDKLLSEALSSLTSQTYKDFDVLIVLDECWENTEKEILKSDYNFKYTILKREKKEGLAYAKNFGLKHIDSELVAFLDADDLYMPTKLEKQMKYFQDNDVDFLGTSCLNRIGNRLTNSCFKDGLYVTHQDIKDVINGENVLTHGSMMIKKECLDALGGYNHVKGKEDWDLWKRALEKGCKFYQLKERLYILTLGTSVER